MKLNQKIQIAEDLKQRFANSQIVILTDYKGLDVSRMTQLRRRLTEAQVEYQVAKNSLLVRAAEENDVSLIKDRFKGPSAVVVGYNDPVTPAKILTEFAKENDKLEIKVGVMNGKVLNFEDIKALSALPSREVLLSQVLSAMNGVPTALVRALSDVPRRLVNVLQAIKDQKEAA